jgi:pantetheine-phosphate adenylyltransferase
VTALYAGSFDPPHRGHLDLIRRARAWFGPLIVGVAVNPEKPGFLTVDERVGLLTAELSGCAGVSVTAYSGATVQWAQAHGIGLLVRGLRSAGDLEAEAPMAAINRAHGCETAFLLCEPALALISSRIVRQAIAAGLPVDALVGPATAAALRRVTP